MKLEERDKRLPKHKYTLDELRDLESKLVLITSSNAENRKEVDLFLNVSDFCVFVTIYSTLTFNLFSSLIQDGNPELRMTLRCSYRHRFEWY